MSPMGSGPSTRRRRPRRLVEGLLQTPRVGQCTARSARKDRRSRRFIEPGAQVGGGAPAVAHSWWRPRPSVRKARALHASTTGPRRARSRLAIARPFKLQPSPPHPPSPRRRGMPVDLGGAPGRPVAQRPEGVLATRGPPRRMGMQGVDRREVRVVSATGGDAHRRPSVRPQGEGPAPVLRPPVRVEPQLAAWAARTRQTISSLGYFGRAAGARRPRPAPGPGTGRAWRPDGGAVDELAGQQPPPDRLGQERVPQLDVAAGRGGEDVGGRGARAAPPSRGAGSRPAAARRPGRQAAGGPRPRDSGRGRGIRARGPGDAARAGRPAAGQRLVHRPALRRPAPR